MQRNSITLFQYAGFLFVIGLASAFYSAEDRTAGWNGHGVSGLIACGSAAVVVAVLAWLTGKGNAKAPWIGLALAFMLLSYGGYTLFSQLRDVEGNATKLIIKRAEKHEILSQDAAERGVLYKGGVFGVMAIFSLSTFMRLGLALRHDQTA